MQKQDFFTILDRRVGELNQTYENIPFAISSSKKPETSSIVLSLMPGSVHLKEISDTYAGYQVIVLSDWINEWKRWRAYEKKDVSWN